MYRIGIDLGGTNIAVGVVDDCHNIIAEASVPTGAFRPAEEMVADMSRAVEMALDKAGLIAADCASIGIGSPGTCDSEAGTVLRAYNLGWFNVPVCQMLHDRFGIPVHLSNDANCAALAEIVAGAAVGRRDMILITLGTGVGGGVIVNGKVIDGSHGAGGEIGHITVNRHETATCGCGKHGCLEQYSSATGVVRCMKKLLDENPDAPCTLRGTDFAAKDVFDAARAGDALAAREVDEMTDTLGMALASIASTTDPEMFMVGGGVARAGDVLFNPLREHFKTYAFSSCRETPIVAATLGNDAGIYGAVRLIVGE